MTSRDLIRSLMFAGAVLGLTFTGVQQGTAASFSAKTFTKCQKTINKAAQKLSGAKLKGALDCADRLLACQLAEELDGANFAACAADANSKCDVSFTKIIDSETKLIESATKKCPVELTPHDLRSRRGLGYGDIDDACGALAPAANATDLATIVDCVVRSVECRTDETIEQLLPRTGELFTRVGLDVTYADQLPCLAAQPASPSAGSDVKSLAGCQKAIHKGGQKKLKIQQKALLSCSDSVLDCQLPLDRAEDSYGESLECLAKADAKCTKRLAKVAKLAVKWDDGFAKSCGALALADVQAGLGFALTCPGAAVTADVNDCADAGSEAPLERAVGTIQPRTCAALKSLDANFASAPLAGNEDVCVPQCGNGFVEGAEECDDANADNVDACLSDCTTGPTLFEVVSIPSGATPANTPDGTPGNAVPGGGTLETQFGSTVFDLNKATFTRYYIPGSGDPDVVIVGVPGFAGGAHSYKYLAENVLVRAQIDGTHVVEVWVYDRRTNQLEDLLGVGIAESEKDPLLAFNWFFGTETGLPVDARLPRRAVFHAGSDVAFLANWTPHVFSRDIDAVIENALALPSAPTVFLAGHSFGTTMAARYASTDFDAGGGVDAGHAKLGGLILFEGGGASIPASPPTDDELDLIIARADGGLYSAVANGDARCVDGTPCPGGDADCVAVALPAGALTNKCVNPVDAYTGSNTSGLTFITPAIHAAGDVSALQAPLDPDGQTLVQIDFGIGAAPDLVDGLSILDAFPPATTAAAVGFFLDDDFSPVSAFQASLGYSENGVNFEPFPDIIQPASAFSPDPFRTWTGSEFPQLANAIPHNGASTAPGTRHGQEKEVTLPGVVFPMLHSGGQNFGDWYFASSGLGVTSPIGGIDSTSLSVGRGRPDIENLTEATAIDVPVIAFGGTNGLTPSKASFQAFAQTIGTCTAPSCDGVTPRVVTPWFNFFGFNDTVYGDIAGGFEAHLSEGYAHVDILSAEDDAENNVYDPLMDFILRNTP